MDNLRVYMPPIVLLVWAVIVKAGWHDDLAQLICAVTTGAAVGVCVDELGRRYHEHNKRQGRHGHHYS